MPLETTTPRTRTQPYAGCYTLHQPEHAESTLSVDGWRYIINTVNLVEHAPSLEPCGEGMMS